MHLLFCLLIYLLVACSLSAGFQLHANCFFFAIIYRINSIAKKIILNVILAIFPHDLEQLANCLDLCKLILKYQQVNSASAVA